MRGTTASARHTRPARRAVAVALVAAVEVVASAHGRAMAAVVGGFSRRGGGEVPGASSYAVQMAALKGEDAFVAAPEVSGRAPTGGGARRRSRRRDRANARAAVADLLACYAVFDGHVNADASAHAEREMLDALVACVAAAPPAAPLESACDAAFRAVEASFAKSDPARPASWPCVACRGRSAPREGGTTACVVLAQRVPNGGDGGGVDGGGVDVVAANAGDSGAILVPLVPNTRRGASPAALSALSADTSPPPFVRLTRDHVPDDPREAERLTRAGARLGRLRRGVTGAAVGPTRLYPGGFATSRAIGDLASPAVICEPECARVPLPREGARVLVASDGVWRAVSDETAAKLVAEAADADDAARTIVRAVVEARGVHDDVTALVAEFPPTFGLARAPEAPEAFHEAPEAFREAFDAREAFRRAVRPSATSSTPTRGDRAASAGRTYIAEEDVTVRRGASASRGDARDASARGANAGSVADPPREVERKGSERERRGGGGCLARLCGDGLGLGLGLGLDLDLDRATDGFERVDADGPGSFDDDFELGDVVGRGAYGVVRLAALRRRDGSEDGAAAEEASLGPLGSGGSGGSEDRRVVRLGGGGERREDRRGRSPRTPRSGSSDASRFAFAAKSIVGNGTRASAAATRAEVDALAAVSGRHPCLPTLYGAYERTTRGVVPGALGAVRVCRVVTEACFGGDAARLAATRPGGRLSAREWKRVAAQLLSALAFAHACGVAHGDVKPENLLVRRRVRRPSKTFEDLSGDDEHLLEVCLVDFGGVIKPGGGNFDLAFIYKKFLQQNPPPKFTEGAGCVCVLPTG